EGEDLGAGETLLQFCHDTRHRTCPFQPDDDGRARTGQGDAGLAGDGLLLQLGEDGRVGQPERLVQAVMEGGGEELRVAARDRRAEERRLRRGGGGLGVRELRGEAAARLQRVNTLTW